MKQQHTLMKFDPATGAEKPYPSHAEQWRKYHGAAAWLFNPWTGTRRRASGRIFGRINAPPVGPTAVGPAA